MTRQILKSKIPVILALILACTVWCSSDAFARGGQDHYSYRGGRWYNSGWFWGGVAAALTIGAIVAALPPRYETVYVNGVPYYYYDNTYYRPCATGYVVVPTPTITPEEAAFAGPVVATTPAAEISAAEAPEVARPQAASGDEVVVNIPDTNGGYTPVTLIKHKTGYVGPQGEYYENHPTVGQLKVLYGK